MVLWNCAFALRGGEHWCVQELRELEQLGVRAGAMDADAGVDRRTMRPREHVCCCAHESRLGGHWRQRNGLDDVDIVTVVQHVLWNLHQNRSRATLLCLGER